MPVNNPFYIKPFFSAPLFKRSLGTLALILQFLAISFPSPALAQQKNKQSKTLPFENIHIVLDKDRYLSGDNIWFSASLKLNNGESALSRILYLELYNEERKAITQKKFLIENGFVQGSFNIPSAYPSATYFLRAYTTYNRNFPVEYFYLQTIEIINPQTGIPYQKPSDSISIFHFPKEENTNAQQIGFSINSRQYGAKPKVIVLANGKLIRQAEVLENNWGYCKFNSEDSLIYSLALINKEKDTVYKKLTFKNNTEYHLTSKSTEQGDQIIQISTTKNALDSQAKKYRFEFYNQTLNLLAQHEFQFSKQNFRARIPQNLLTENGLYWVILKNPENQILTVHSFGVRTNAELDFRLDKKNYKNRKTIQIQLKPTDSTRVENIGIKIVQKNAVFSTLEELKRNFEAAPLFLSYLKNTFRPQELSPKESEICFQFINYQLNKTRFKKLLFPPRVQLLKWIPEIRDISISGKVLDKRTGEPLANLPLYLSVFHENPQIHIYNSRVDGSFLFSLNNFEKKQDVFLCPMIEDSDEMEVKVNSDFAPEFPNIKAPPLSVDLTYISILKQWLIAQETAKIFQTTQIAEGKKRSPLPYPFSNPQVSILLDDYVETPTLAMVFKEIVPNVYLNKHHGKYLISLYDEDRRTHYKKPLILVDNLPIFDVDELLKLSPKKIKQIEVYPQPFILGNNNINGLLMIQTFTQNFGGIPMPKSSNFLEYQSLSIPNIYLPQIYDDSTEINSRIPDFRSLLYWNSRLKSHLINSIYTSDLTGKYEVILFGNYKNGVSFSRKQEFTVER
jgi:hypothetical protein